MDIRKHIEEVARMKKGLLIFQKIILIQIISIVVIMTVFAVYLFNSSLQKELGNMAKATEQTKFRLSSYLGVYLWNYDDAAADKLIQQEMTDDYVHAILLMQDNKLVNGKYKSDKGEIVPIKVLEEMKSGLDRDFPKVAAKIAYKDKNMENEKELGEAVIYTTDAVIRTALTDLLIQTVIQALLLVLVLGIITFIVLNIFLARPLNRITVTASRISEGDVDLQAEGSNQREIETLANAFNTMTSRLKDKAEGFKRNNDTLTEIIAKAKEIIMRLNSSTQEIEAATQEQTSGANQHASGITEVSATLEELTITARQITKNVGELVFSSEEVIKFLQENEKNLMQTVSQLDEVGKISMNNASSIGELGKRSVLINEMVELIKEVANKTNILSINASIEASRSGEAGAGFSVVAAEIRELSKETIESAKKADKAAKEIQDFLNTIIITSENESRKVMDSGRIVKGIYDNIEAIVSRINNNYTFTQKIDVSIKQQETGSSQAAETMKQMAEIARQSAEIARQTLGAVRDIVGFSKELELTVTRVKMD
jgi:methyl-accepting chemotaxis protein